jgi:hypothetical protein
MAQASLKQRELLRSATTIRAVRSTRSGAPAFLRLAGALFLAALALAGPGASSAFASRTQWSLFEDHPALVGSDDATREKMLDEVKALGADTLRVQMKWNEIAPDSGAKTRPVFDATDPAAYPGFGRYDDVIRRALSKGFRIVLTVTGDAPRWATAGARGGNYKPDPVEYGKFAEAVGKRYSGDFLGLPKIIYYTIWNEPNHINFAKPTSQAPRIYRRLVDAGIPALRRTAAPESKIFVGELKPSPAKGMGPAKFIRAWLCLDKKFKRLRGRAARKAGCQHFKRIDADGFAHHPYGPPELRPKKADIININVIRRLGKYLDLAAKAKRIPRHLPIYDTEFGLQTNPPDIFVGTSPSRQGELINEKEWFSYRYQRLKSYSQYQLFDDPARPGPPAIKWSGFQTGLRFFNERKKPSYEAYKFPIVVRILRHKKRRAGKVEIWGRVRPGTGARYVQLQRLKKGRRFVKVGARIRTSSLGYFDVKKPNAKYRFQAYARKDSNSPLELLGTSRTARPRKLLTR